MYIWMHLYFQVKSYFKIILHIRGWLIFGSFNFFSVQVVVKAKTLGELMKEVEKNALYSIIVQSHALCSLLIMVLLMWHSHCSGPCDFCWEKAPCLGELAGEKYLLPAYHRDVRCVKCWGNTWEMTKLLLVRFIRSLSKVHCSHQGHSWTLHGDSRKIFKEEVRVELGIERCLGTHQADKCWGRTF